jgi:hypothetical protein
MHYQASAFQSQDITEATFLKPTSRVSRTKGVRSWKTVVGYFSEPGVCLKIVGGKIVITRVGTWPMLGPFRRA